ncbi:MAG TPA: dihydropteroate synthase [Pyrinomonadaceae bacterium]
MIWQTSRRRIGVDRVLIMAILNTTPDSFSDGGLISGIDDAVRRAEKLIAEGADVLDIGGESTRPGSARVLVDEEIRRVIPVIEGIAKRFDVPISVDTSKAAVGKAAIDAGAEILNDISGLRFDAEIGEIAARSKTGLILMHSRGEFETMHRQEPVEDILSEVSGSFQAAIAKAESFGVAAERIVLDVGIGFGKTPEQNLELIARLGKLTEAFPQFPILVGTSRKSFIGRILNDAPVDKRLPGSLASVVVAVWNGAKIVRVHDVKDTADAVRTVEAIKAEL